MDIYYLRARIKSQIKKVKGREGGGWLQQSKKEYILFNSKDKTQIETHVHAPRKFLDYKY